MLYQKLLVGNAPYFLFSGKATAFEVHYHPEFELSFCLQGEFTLCTGNAVHHIRRGDLAMVGPMTPHEYFTSNDPQSRRLTLEIGPAMLGEYFDPLAAQYAGFQLFQLQNTDDRLRLQLYGLLRELDHLYTNRPPFSDMLIKGDVYRLCALLLRLIAEQKNEGVPLQALRDVRKIEKALEIVYNRYPEKLDIQTVSAACGYAPSNFCKIFKHVTGETFHALLNRHRIEIARVLLKESDDSIERIALAVGFADLKSFCRVFKQLTGETAGSYKKQTTR